MLDTVVRSEHVAMIKGTKNPCPLGVYVLLCPLHPASMPLYFCSNDNDLAYFLFTIKIFFIPFRYGLIQNIEYSSLCYTVYFIYSSSIC